MLTITYVEKSGGFFKRVLSRKKVVITDEELSQKLGLSVYEFRYKMQNPSYFNTKERNAFLQITGAPFVEMMIGKMNVYVRTEDGK